MSKRIFINNLNSYVSQAIFKEFRNDVNEDGETNDDANLIYATYIDKDSSDKPQGVNKMLKRSKPRLTMKYLSECDVLIYDLHSGNPRDVDLAIAALRKYNIEEEKILILISSLMVWNNTPAKLKEIKEGNQADEEEKAEGDENIDQEEGDKEDKRSEADAKSRVIDEEDIDGGEQQEEHIENNEDQPAKPIVKQKKYIELPYTEEDYALRIPSDEYEEIKRIEDELLTFKKENVKTYVIASGIQYGKGECILNSHFKKAWLQDPLKLPYVDEGKNRVPTIHVVDLARIVKKVYETKPEKQYIFAIDNTRRPQQKGLISAISNGIGTGLIESVDQLDSIKKVHPKKTPLQLDLDWRVPLMLNLRLKPSTLFVADGGTGEEEEQADVDFNWHCKSGLAANIQLVNEEFCKERGLKPFKVVITGPPASGKSSYAKQIAEHYNITHIHMTKLLNEIENWNKEKEEEVFIKRQLRSKRKQAEELIRLEKQIEQDQEGEDKSKDVSLLIAEEGRELNENEEPKIDEEVKKNEQQQQVNDSESEDDYVEDDIKRKLREYKLESEVEGGQSCRYPDSLMDEAVRWRLNQNDCQNRGYVLDGYPKTYKEAIGVFYITPQRPEKKIVLNEEGEPVPQEDEIDEEEMKKLLRPQFQKNIYPDSVIMLRGTQLMIQQKLNKISNDQLKVSHWMPNDFSRRWEFYQQDNIRSQADKLVYGGNEPIVRFFQENKTELFEIDCDGVDFEVFESMRIYIERNGRSYNYLSSIQELNLKREEHLTLEESENKDTQKQEEHKQNQTADQQKEHLEQLADKRLKDIKKHMQDLQLCDKLNMRQFLMKYIIPVLTEGMIEVCKVGPIDPVDYLADYIFKRSIEFREQQ